MLCYTFAPTWRKVGADHMTKWTTSGFCGFQRGVRGRNRTFCAKTISWVFFECATRVARRAFANILSFRLKLRSKKPQKRHAARRNMCWRASFTREPPGHHRWKHIVLYNGSRWRQCVVTGLRVRSWSRHIAPLIFGVRFCRGIDIFG